MAIIINTRVGTNKGTARIWLQGNMLERGNFTVASQYNRQIKGDKLFMAVNSKGRFKVSRKSGGIPVIDIQNQMLETVFGIGTKIKAVIRSGKVVIRKAIQTLKTHQREARVIGKIEQGETLSTASLFHGGGIMAKALHQGMGEAGVDTAVRVACEMQWQYMDASLAANPELFNDTSVLVTGPLEDAGIPSDTHVDILEAGIPCTGASTSGRAKNKTANAEQHAASGAMFYYTLRWIEALQPAVVVLENVKAYQSTASMDVVRSMLDQLDYDLHETVLNGNDFGALENRDRMVAVAVSKGLADHMDDLLITPTHTKAPNVGAILEPISDDSDLWQRYDYLNAKAIRDKNSGKGFARQMIGAADEQVGVIGRGYAKARSTEPFLSHPSDEAQSRLFTPVEHARLKAIPEQVVHAMGVAKTTAHEILGQSCIFPIFTAVGQAIATALADLKPIPDSRAGCAKAVAVEAVA